MCAMMQKLRMRSGSYEPGTAGSYPLPAAAAAAAASTALLRLAQAGASAGRRPVVPGANGCTVLAVASSRRSLTGV